MKVEIVELVNSVVVDASSVDVVEIGIAGPQGPPGASGAAATSYVHTQAIPSATWTVTHNLGMYPAVTVIDSSNRVVEGDTAYPSSNSVVLTFSAAFSGVAYLS